MTDTVIIFPGQPLVSVLAAPGRFSVALAKPGERRAIIQVIHPTLEAAERSAREGAEMCGWPFVGIRDEERVRALEDWRHQVDGGA